eukprot:3934568-Rhodomonas_salina.2
MSRGGATSECERERLCAASIACSRATKPSLLPLFTHARCMPPNCKLQTANCKLQTTTSKQHLPTCQRQAAKRTGTSTTCLHTGSSSPLSLTPLPPPSSSPPLSVLLPPSRSSRLSSSSLPRCAELHPARAPTAHRPPTSHPSPTLSAQSARGLPPCLAVTSASAGTVLP